MRKLVLLSGLIICLSACQKEEMPILPYERGEIQSASVDMGAGYSNQIFFDLQSASVQGLINVSDWDLAFGYSADHVYLNDGRLMAAWKSPYTDLSSAVDTSGFQEGKKVEVAAEIFENPAIADLEGVYLIDLGFNQIGLPMGLIWFRIDESDDTAYRISYRPFDSAEITSVSIARSSNEGYAYFSFDRGETLSLPMAQDWDIKFAKYTFQFDDPPIPYLVTGVILNNTGVDAAEYSAKPFENISATDTSEVEWSNRPDIIGYDWKTYSFDTGTYSVDTHRTWLIRTSEGFYYKLRFTDFYDENGNVGVPNFEFRLI